MRRAVMPILLLVVLMLGVVFAVGESQLSRARREVARLRSLPPALRNLPPLPEADAASAAGSDSVSGAAEKSESVSSSNRDRQKKMFRMLMKTPAFRRMLRAQAEREMNKQYAALYRKLGMTDSSPLAELLRQKALVYVDAMTRGDIDNPTAEERNKLWREARAAEEEIEKQIKELLGAEAYAEYEAYEETIPERRQMDVLKEKLYSAGLGLAPSQEEALIALMHEARTAPLTPEENAEVYALSTSLPEERNLKPEQMELKRMEALHQRYLDAAAQILTPEQLKVYEEYLNQWQDYWSTLADYQPSPDVESHDRADAKVANDDQTLAQPVNVDAGKSEPEQWGDNQNGSSSTVTRTSGNMLGVKFDVGSGWGSGLTFSPEAAAMNSDETVNAAGAAYLTVRLKAPAGINVRFGLLESGADWFQSAVFSGANGADGEAYRHPGLTTQAGWQTYTFLFRN